MGCPCRGSSSHRRGYQVCSHSLTSQISDSRGGSFLSWRRRAKTCSEWTLLNVRRLTSFISIRGNIKWSWKNTDTKFMINITSVWCEKHQQMKAKMQRINYLMSKRLKGKMKAWIQSFNENKLRCILKQVIFLQEWLLSDFRQKNYIIESKKYWQFMKRFKCTRKSSEDLSGPQLGMSRSDHVTGNRHMLHLVRRSDVYFIIIMMRTKLFKLIIADKYSKICIWTDRDILLS